MDRIEKAILAALFVFLTALFALLAGGHADLFQKRRQADDPFPLDRVSTVRIVMAEKDWQRILSNPRAKQYVRADFWFNGTRYPNVAVRPKGNSSLRSVVDSGSTRLSLKVDFNFFNSAQTFCGLKKVCLNNEFADPTFIREVLGYEVFEQMDIPTPRAAFVDLTVNNTHLGLYTQVEAIDKAFLARHFSNAEGNLYKPEVGAALLNWTQADVQDGQANAPARQQDTRSANLALNIGGSRLGDLLRLLERERSSDEAQAANDDMNRRGGVFPGGPPPMPFAGDRKGNEGPFIPGPPAGFGPDPNMFMRPEDRPFMEGPDPRGDMFLAALFSDSPPDPNTLARRGNRRSPFPLAAGPGGPGGPGGGPPGPMGRFGRGGLLEAVGLKTNENHADHTALFRLLDVLNNCPEDRFPAEIEKVLNVDQVLRYLAVSVMMVHLDNYIGSGHNYYLYEIDGYFTILPWDLNQAFGGFSMRGSQQELSDFYIDAPVTGSMEDRPLVGRLLAHKPYLERYHQYLEQLLSGAFAEGVIESRIDTLAALVRPYVEADETKFFSLADFDKGLNGGFAQADRRSPETRQGTGREPAQQMDIPEDMPADLQFLFGIESSAQTNRRGGLGRRPGGPGGPGMAAPGLKSFIRKRRISVRGQLDGTLASKPTAEEQQRMNQSLHMMPGPGRMR